MSRLYNQRLSVYWLLHIENAVIFNISAQFLYFLKFILTAIIILALWNCDSTWQNHECEFARQNGRAMRDNSTSLFS